MDTNGLVFIGFIFFEAIKQILYCFLTIYSHNLTTYTGVPQRFDEMSTLVRAVQEPPDIHSKL